MKTLISDLIPPLDRTALLGVSACLVSLDDFEAELQWRFEAGLNAPGFDW